MPRRDDRDGRLAAVSVEGHCLAYCPTRWIDDREIVLAAVRQDGLALQYAHKNKKRDHDVLVAAVRQHPDAITHAKLQRPHEWLEKFFSPGVDLLEVMGTAGAPMCTVAPFPSGTVGRSDAPGIKDGIAYEAHWGLGGRTITGVLDRLATVGELAIAIHDQVPYTGRFCLIMPGNDEPITPTVGAMSLFKYLLKQKPIGSSHVTV